MKPDRRTVSGTPEGTATSSRDEHTMSRVSKRSSQRWPAAAGVMVGFLVIIAIALIAWSTTWFDEDFEDAQSGWSVGLDPTGRGSWRISNGFYEVFILHTDSISRSLAPPGELIESPFRLESIVRVMPGSTGEAGVIFGYRSSDGQEEYNTFGIFEDGSYRLGRMLRGRLEDLPVTTAPIGLHPARSNTLRIEIDAGVIRFYGNERLLATVTEEGVDASGEVGLFGRSKSDPFFVARFDSINLSLPVDE